MAIDAACPSIRHREELKVLKAMHKTMPREV
jgi:hypothetical protein